MGQKRDRVNGALKKAFAAKHGKSLRWAQIEAAKGSATWKAFLAEQFAPPSPGAGAEGNGGGGPAGGGAGGSGTEGSGAGGSGGEGCRESGYMGGRPAGGASDLERAGEAKESAWQILKRMEDQLNQAAESGDVGLVASFTRAVREARANWERAGMHEQRLLEASGSLVPVHVFHEVKARGVAPLAELIGQQRDFIGSRLEAGTRQSFYAAWDEWGKEWNRKVGDLNQELNALLSHV